MDSRLFKWYKVVKPIGDASTLANEFGVCMGVIKRWYGDDSLLLYFPEHKFMLHNQTTSIFPVKAVIAKKWYVDESRLSAMKEGELNGT